MTASAANHNVRHRRALFIGLMSGWIYFAIADLATAETDWASILMYHRIGEDQHSVTSIPVETLEQHIEELASDRYAVLPLPQIVSAIRSGQALPERTVGITFDDAFRSVYLHAAPRLQAANLPFTVFVATDSVDQQNRGFMSWDELRELQAAGATIGNQTATHPHMPLLTRRQIINEIRKSNRRFRTELGRNPVLFSYPYGEISASVRDLVARAGFAAAFGQQSGVIHSDSDRYQWPRFSISAKYSDGKRLRTAINAMPLKIEEIEPKDWTLSKGSPADIRLTLSEDYGNLHQLACYASNHNEALPLERIDDRQFSVKMVKEFSTGRSRINCTLPGPERRWRWYGALFYRPEN